MLLLLNNVRYYIYVYASAINFLKSPKNSHISFQLYDEDEDEGIDEDDEDEEYEHLGKFQSE